MPRYLKQINTYTIEMIQKNSLRFKDLESKLRGNFLLLSRNAENIPSVDFEIDNLCLSSPCSEVWTEAKSVDSSLKELCSSVSIESIESNEVVNDVSGKG